jgi:processive 1,2-diacylglycerol beta-glucosyltransferase
MREDREPAPSRLRARRTARAPTTTRKRDPENDRRRAMANKVLILSASAGAGHVRCAQALEHAFQQSGRAREIRHVDALDFTNKAFRTLYSKTYVDMVDRIPEVLGWLYDALDTPWEKEKRRLAWDKLNTRPFVKLLEREQPDLIVCTHFMPAEMVSWMKAKHRLACPQTIVVTDFDVHAMWLCHHYEHYFVALEETRRHMMKLGIAERDVTMTGIPIDPVFAQHKDKTAMRKKLGLAADRTTILLSAGGFGVGPVEHIVTTLMELERPAQIVAICGKNKELEKRMEKLAAGRSRAKRATLVAVGYTTAMDEYMSAADVLVGKPGGLTTSEALAKGLLVVIVNPIPGQEERNSDHLLEDGAAIRCNNLPVLAYKLDRLLDDPARVTHMRANVARLAKPTAAADVVRISLGIADMARR